MGNITIICPKEYSSSDGASILHVLHNGCVLMFPSLWPTLCPEEDNILEIQKHCQKLVSISMFSVWFSAYSGCWCLFYLLSFMFYGILLQQSWGHRLYFQGFSWWILKMWCTVTIIQSTVCTHCQKAQAFDSMPGRTAKNTVCFPRTSPCLCVWRRKLPFSLLIRCYKWKTLLFTTVFLETYFNRCREAVKLNERRMLGTTGKKKPLNFEV